MEFYPLKFYPIYKDKPWGGEKIKTILGKDFSPLVRCGESWELSAVKNNVSVVKNGTYKGRSLDSLVAEYQGELVGQRIFEKYGEVFPLLIKFIHTNSDSSVHVHPNDELAQRRYMSIGKSEMYYVLDSDEGATVINGFNQPVDKEKFLQAHQSGKLQSLLNYVPASADDVLYIPAGRVHTIGKGLLLTEIQQTSELTYRLFDFDRVDEHGKKRDLQVEEGIEAINFNTAQQTQSTYADGQNDQVELVDSEHFTTNKLDLTHDFKIENQGLDCFKIYICLKGNARIAREQIKPGEVILVPARMKKYIIETSGHVVLLESYIRK